jgi:hypothetical protein
MPSEYPHSWSEVLKFRRKMVKNTNRKKKS